MRGFYAIKMAAVTLAAVGLLAPMRWANAAEEPPAGPALAIVDVALAKGGVLHGQVVRQDGTAVAEAEVELLQGGRKIVSTTTDRAGRFRASTPGGGVYQVTYQGGGGVVRAWSPGTAPPSAKQVATVVAPKLVARGQGGKGWPEGSILANPWVITGIGLTAVGVPVALHNARSDRKESS